MAIIGIISGQATAGAGYAPTRGLLEGHGELPPFYTLLKLLRDVAVGVVRIARRGLCTFAQQWVPA